MWLFQNLNVQIFGLEFTISGKQSTHVRLVLSGCVEIGLWHFHYKHIVHLLNRYFTIFQASSYAAAVSSKGYPEAPSSSSTSEIKREEEREEQEVNTSPCKTFKTKKTTKVQ